MEYELKKNYDIVKEVLEVLLEKEVPINDRNLNQINHILKKVISQYENQTATLFVGENHVNQKCVLLFQNLNEKTIEVKTEIYKEKPSAK